MTAPVIRQFAGTIPDKGQSQTAFDTNVDAFLDWQALQFAPDLVAFGTFASDTAAALVAANLPSLAGRALDAVRVNAAADGVEFANVTAAGWALLDDADAAAQRVTLGLVIGTDVSAIASPTFTGTPTAPTAAAATDTTQIATTAYTRTAIADVLNAAGSAPLYACRAWVNFNGVGTVAIRASGNVSSITDNGVGDYTVNFTTAMPDANYAALVTFSFFERGHQYEITSRLAGSIRFKLWKDVGGSYDVVDSSDINLVVLR
jgi:hypothetical protein